MLCQIESKYGEYKLNKCKEKGCKISFKGLKNYLILDAEAVSKDFMNGKVCDCIIYSPLNERKGHNLIGICLIELKNKNFTASDIQEKLQNGVVISEKILKNCLENNTYEYDVFPITLAKGWDHTEFRIVCSKKIKVGKRKLSIITDKCGGNLFEILHKYR